MHHHSRRLTPHPAGLPFVVGTLFVVLAAFLAAADPCTSRSPVASRATAQPIRVARDVAPTPAPGAAQRPSSGDARAALTDSVRSSDHACAEHAELRQKAGRSEKRLASGAAATVLDAPGALSRARRSSAALTLRGRVAPSPVVPRAPPLR